MINASDLLLRLLTNPSCRIYRHLLLFILSTAMVSVNFYVELFIHKNVAQSVLLGGVLLVPIYLSIFVLTPCFLLRGKFGYYVISVFLVVILALLFSCLFRLDTINEQFKSFESWFSFASFFASIVLLILIIAGSSTIILFQHYLMSGQYIDKLENATIQSELEQLKNQINPHFLFNMLNNANVLIKENPTEAVVVLSKLKDLLNYQLKDSSSEQVCLEDDIHFLTDFLNMEKIRRDNFDFIVSIEGDIGKVVVPPLLFIPFVENAVKHNNDNKILSYVHLYFKEVNSSLTFICINSKPAKQQEQQTDGGIGLTNIRRRLELLYGSDHSLQISETDITYTINLCLKFK